MTDNGLVDDIAQSQPADYGVLSPAATVVTDDNPNWTSGIDFETPNCAAQVKLSAICSSATGVTVVTRDPSAGLYRRYMPFDIESFFSCSTFGNIDYEQIASDHLNLAQQKAIEYELWTGALSKQQAATWNSSQHNGESFPNEWLASPNAIDVTPTPGTPVKAKYGLALLEKALGDCGIGIKGVIHATRDVASALNQKANKQGALETSLGNFVIAGTGYAGTGPDGTKPSNARVWMYATGPVSVRLGPITGRPDTRTQSVDIRNNTVGVYANRAAAVAWDSCCHYAVLVDLTLDYA